MEICGGVKLKRFNGTRDIFFKFNFPKMTRKSKYIKFYVGTRKYILKRKLSSQSTIQSCTHVQPDAMLILNGSVLT